MTCPVRILDLFCGAGLVARGLHRIGVETVGVDIAPQPRYPGPFIQADALSLDMRFIRYFDGVWASPPCLKDTVLNASARREQRRHGGEVIVHPDLITPTRALLKASGLPFVIENVEKAPLLDPVILCGSMWALGAWDDDQRWSLQRHRKFEANFPLKPPCQCSHCKPVVGIYGGHARKRAASSGGRGTADGWTRSGRDIMAEAMGLCADEAAGLTTSELSQGIPPQYAEHVGQQMMDHIAGVRDAA